MKLRASVLACVTAFLPLQNACAAEPGWPQSIAIATASPGGTYDVYGQALADILGKELGIEVTARGHRVRPDDPKYALPLRPSADCGEGSQTRRWRKRDSNQWSHFKEDSRAPSSALRFLAPGCARRDRFFRRDPAAVSTSCCGDAGRLRSRASAMFRLKAKWVIETRCATAVLARRQYPSSRECLPRPHYKQHQ